MRLFVFLTTLLLAGCGTMDPEVNANKFTGPNGRPAYAMMCNGIGQSIARCYQTADSVCPAGYDVLEHTTIALGGNPRETLSVECR